MSDAVSCPKTLRVTVPAGIVSPAELLRVLADGLLFPSYFGCNWDALFDCLCDFTWLEDRTRVVICHRDVPELPPPHRDTYLKVLSDAVDSWRDFPREHTLEVEFSDGDLASWINHRSAPDDEKPA